MAPGSIILWQIDGETLETVEDFILGCSNIIAPVFLPGESHGHRSLVGCRLWGCTELDTTEVTQQQQQQMYHVFVYMFVIQACMLSCSDMSSPS